MDWSVRFLGPSTEYVHLFERKFYPHDGLARADPEEVEGPHAAHRLRIHSQPLEIERLPPETDLSHRMYQLNGFRKSTPSQNCQLVILVSYE